MQQVRIYSVYDDLKNRENSLSSDFSYEKYNWNYQELSNSKNSKIIASLANFWDPAQYYCLFLNSLIVEMKKVIIEINDELLK